MLVRTHIKLCVWSHVTVENKTLRTITFNNIRELSAKGTQTY